MHRYLQNRNLIHPRNFIQLDFCFEPLKITTALGFCGSLTIDQELVFNIFKIKSKLIKINISANVSKSLIFSFS